ncbi:hypothetical protein OA57_08180 [Chelonobacter oris]|uniref:Uncharacterized protein n=1 Tax=Chelonobacter oris TaxID=505317 RepID=A0A0A3ASG8_9PAST|nr:hypothetical protein [Chelonobacter oris]KGQ70035.1 hypothetical protein OA57_08180 [Chelonobacter oris]
MPDRLNHQAASKRKVKPPTFFQIDIKQVLKTSYPFDYKHYPSSLPKISDDSTLPWQAHQAKANFSDNQAKIGEK